MTDKTFLYQDIAEPASLEVPSVTSWLPEPNQPPPHSWAAKWSIAALTAVTLAYVGEPITPAETITLDKWYQPFSTPTPPKSGLHASLQQFGNVDVDLLTQPEDVKVTAWFEPLSEPRTPPKPGLGASQQQWINQDPLQTLPGDATEFQTYLPFVELPITDGPITLQGEFAYGAPVAISDTRWLTPFSEPVIAPLRFEYPQEAFVEDFEAGGETITPDKWYQPFNQPVPPDGYMVVGDNALLSLEVTNIAWHVPFSEPLHAKPRLHPAYQPFEVNDPQALTEPEQVHVQWLVPLSEPVLPKPAVAQYQEFAFGHPPITATLEQGWFQPLNNPPDGKQPVAYQMDFAYNPDPTVFTTTPTTVKRRRRGIYRRLGAYS